jgi:hypothetical protein
MVRHCIGREFSLVRDRANLLISTIVGSMPTASLRPFMTQNYDIKINLSSKICASSARPAGTSF